MCSGLVSGILLVLLHVTFLRFFRWTLPRAIFTAFLISGLSSIGLLFFVSDSTPSFVQICTALFIYLTIFLVYIEFFSMICRGFSFHIIKLVYEREPISLPEVVQFYGSGMGALGIQKKRIDGLRDAGLLSMDQDRVWVNSPKALVIIWVSRFYKKLLRIQGGG